MAAKRDMEHFLRFSLLAVFCIACLAVLGLATLVLDGPGQLVLPGGANLAGQAVADTSYHVGEVSDNGLLHDVKLRGESLYISSPEGMLYTVPLRQSEATFLGVWARKGESTPISVAHLVATFHFPSGSVRVPLRAVYQR